MRVNTNLRVVAGGYIERIWMGDHWAWRSYDENRNPLPFTAKTAVEAMKKVRGIR